MADIRDVDVFELDDFLLINNVKTNNDNETYEMAFNLMKNENTNYNNVSINIIQWMLAYNALQNKLDIPSYSISQIKNLKHDDFDNLYISLGLIKSNIDNVIKILRYMHKLKGSELDFEINTDLYSNLLITSDFQTIIGLLKAKPSLKNKISELFYDMLVFNKSRYMIRDKLVYFSKRNLPYYTETSNFMRSLIDLKYFDIIEKILPILSEYDMYNYFNLLELFTEKLFLVNYLKYIPDDPSFVFIFSNIVLNKVLLNKDIDPYYLIHKILDIAIKNKKLNILQEFIKNLRLSRHHDEPNKFRTRLLILSDKEREILKILLDEAKQLVNNNVISKNL